MALLILTAVLLSFGPLRQSWAEPVPVLAEYEAKAAFLFNFAKFVHWPDTDSYDTPLRIGVVGNNPFGAVIHQLENSTIAGRPVRILFPSTSRELYSCEVLFISRSEAANLSELLARLNDVPILTVSDMEGFTARGGMIGMVLHNNRIRFEINLDAAHYAGLDISSKLLQLAKNADELARRQRP